MKVLLTGAAGQVGLAVQASVPPGVALTSLTRAELDITRQAEVESAVRRIAPDVIINAAAYTAVDKAESEPAIAFQINAEGPQYLATVVRSLGYCRLIHISTDYVFDGASQKPYRPGDPKNPINVYGHSKLAGENAVAEALGPRATILRTAWVYAHQGRNFLLTMLRLMREKRAVRVVADQLGSPTSARSIAAALWIIAAKPAVDGVLHWTDADRGSWYDFAVAIAAEARAAGLLEYTPEVIPISATEYPTPARRPANSTLDTSAAVETLGFTPRSWREELHETLELLR